MGFDIEHGDELEFEDVEVGASRFPARERRQREAGPAPRRPWWPWAAGAALVVIVIVSIALAGPDNGDSSTTSTTRAHRTTTTVDDATTVVTPTTIDAPVTTFRQVVSGPPDILITTAPARFAIATLPEPTGLRLIARTPDAVLDVDLDEGTVQRHDYPGLTSTGASFMVAGPDWVVVRPADNVPAWRIGTDHYEPAANELATGAAVYPGPFASLWQVGLTPQHMKLIDSEGNDQGVDIGIGDTVPVGSDGALGVLLTGTGGTYVANASGIQRVTTGEVVAAGPTAFLVHECDESLVCVRAVIDRQTGERRVLPGDTSGVTGPVGSISPDGTTAANIVPGPREGRILLTDLSNGNVNNIGAARLAGGLVWTDNGRFLFYVGIDGGVHMWDRQDPGQRYVVALGDDNIIEVAARYGT